MTQPEAAPAAHHEGECDVCDVLRTSGNGDFLEVEPHEPSTFIVDTMPDPPDDELGLKRWHNQRLALVEHHARELAAVEPNASEPTIIGSDDAVEKGQHERADDNQVLRLYFDRHGYEIDYDQWVAIMDEGKDARRIGTARHVGDVLVSTIYTALNRNTDPKGEPWIFETLFLRDGEIVGTRYYTTEMRARIGHVVSCVLAALGWY